MPAFWSRDFDCCGLGGGTRLASLGWITATQKEGCHGHAFYLVRPDDDRRWGRRWFLSRRSRLEDDRCVVAGWAVGPSNAPGQMGIGGIMQRPAAVPESMWLYSFHAEGLEAAMERVTAGGGHVHNGPQGYRAGVGLRSASTRRARCLRWWPWSGSWRGYVPCTGVSRQGETHEPGLVGR
jgi:hypothetical protein